MIPGRLYSRKHNVASTINWNKLFKDESDEAEQLELDLGDDTDVDTTSLTSILGPSTVSISNLSSQTYTVGSSGSWTTPSYTYNSGTITATTPYSNSWNITNTLNVTGDAEITGELTVQGVKLSTRLDEIEQRLAILRPNNDLENKWQELKELGEKYRELEKEILEKEQIWDTLKK